jgi:3',5'-cyclic AMP phosphodiesterase CpdA
VTLRVTVVSDSHLSARTPEAGANWQAVVDDAAHDPPDLVVHAGDIAADGAGRPDDLAFAAGQLGRLSTRVLALPGNHDVGDLPHPGAAGHGGVSPERVDRFRRAIGPDRWAVDAGPWRLVGLDAQLMGSGLAEEEDQWAWLAAAVVPVPGGARHLALFLHKPVAPAPDHPDPTSSWRYLVPAARARLAEALAPAPLRVVVSGHVHQYRCHQRHGVPQVWAPTTWAVLPDRVQVAIGRKACGVVDLALGDDGTVRSELRRPKGLAHHVVGQDVPDPYRD